MTYGQGFSTSSLRLSILLTSVYEMPRAFSPCCCIIITGNRPNIDSAWCNGKKKKSFVQAQHIAQYSSIFSDISTFFIWRQVKYSGRAIAFDEPWFTWVLQHQNELIWHYQPTNSTKTEQSFEHWQFDAIHFSFKSWATKHDLKNIKEEARGNAFW